MDNSHIKSGPIPVLRPIEDIAADPQTTGEQVVAFAYNHLRIGDGKMIGKRMVLQPFQIQFILAVFDNPEGTRYAYLSVAARNGKTMLMAVILLSYIIGPLRQRNIEVASGAMSRDQAALCYKSMTNILSMSPDCEGLYSAVPSSKLITGISTNASYQALSSDAKTGYGRNLKIVMIDEASQVAGPSSAFTDMLESRQGSYDDALQLIISTQAASDMDYFSVAIDTAERENDPHTVCHLYAADKDCDLMDREQWKKANPGLGIFRSEIELQRTMEKAKMIPVKESQARNQFLNERTNRAALAISASIWKGCSGEINLDVFRTRFVSMGLDLSSKNDLTAAVLSAEDDDGIVHVLPFVFCPTHGIEARAERDKAPYDLWVKDGSMIPVGGKVMDFDQIAESLHEQLGELGIEVDEIHYDKHMMPHFQAACVRAGAFTNSKWIGVPQFFRDMGVRLGSALSIMTEEKMRHGSNPALNMAASVAVAQSGRDNISCLAKDLSTQRIDPVVALVMAVWPFGDGREEPDEVDVSAMVA